MTRTVGALLHTGYTVQRHYGQVNFPQLGGGQKSGRLETEVLAELLKDVHKWGERVERRWYNR